MVHGMAHAEDDTPQWIGSSTQTWEVKIELLRCCLDFVSTRKYQSVLQSFFAYYTKYHRVLHWGILYYSALQSTTPYYKAPLRTTTISP